MVLMGVIAAMGKNKIGLHADPEIFEPTLNLLRLSGEKAILKLRQLDLRTNGAF
jgi:hypothetical protein